MKATRDGFGEMMYELCKQDKNLMVLSADLSDSLKVAAVRNDLPDQYIEMGISEQNMAGVAAGAAMVGKTVVATSFAAFNPGRNWEQIRVSICEQNLDVKIVGGHAGLATGPDGGTHQALEDIALMAALPNMKVIAPCDYQEAREATEAMIKTKGPVYLRLTREATEGVNQGSSKFELGKGRVMSKGEDATIIACGLTVPLAMKAAEELLQEVNLRIGVINMHTLKPLDEELIKKVSRETNTIITVEDHQEIGGLGSLVARALAKTSPAIMEMVAVEGKFGQSGTKDELYEHYGLTVTNIKDKILKGLERKVAVLD